MVRLLGEKKSPLNISGTDGPTWVRKITLNIFKNKKSKSTIKKKRKHDQELNLKKNRMFKK